MRRWAIEVTMKRGLLDAEARALAGDIADLGIGIPVETRVSRMYWIEGEIARSGAQMLAERLLADAVADDFRIDGDAAMPPDDAKGWIAEIRLKPGVTDSIGGSVMKGARDLNVMSLSQVKTGKKAYLLGELSEADAQRILEGALVNDVIQAYELRRIG